MLICYEENELIHIWFKVRSIPLIVQQFTIMHLVKQKLKVKGGNHSDI